MTREAVIVSTARTPIGKAYRGAFNDTDAPTMGGHAVSSAVARAGIEPSEVDDVIMGCAMQQGSSGQNIGRTTAVAAGLPNTVAGMSIDRQCSSGMMAIATAAQQVIHDQMPIVVGAGMESISLVQNEHRNSYRSQDPIVIAKSEHAYMSMLETAETVSKRYKISREQQDEYALQSQQRTAVAQGAGKYDDEIVPLPSKMLFVDKETKQQSVHDVNLEKDEGNRPTTTLEGLTGLKPVFEGGVITAGNASQLSDGASASVLMDSKLAEQKGVEPLGAYRGVAVAGLDPDEMGIGPIYAVPKLLQRFNLSMDDIGLWELNEAFAAIALACASDLKIDLKRMNPNGGAIALGHPIGATGVILTTKMMHELDRINGKYGLVSLCIGGGQGIATIFERDVKD